MKKKLVPGTIGGFLGLVIGMIGGGFIGLVVGGTFLGGFDIYEHTGFEGYELAAYVGAIIGALVFTLLGINFALKIAEKKTGKKM
jgi:hypothetical protein